MTGLGPQDGDLDEVDADDAEVEAPANGTHPVGAPDIKISWQKGAKKPAVEGQAALDELAKLGGGSKSPFSVEVLGPESRPDLGFIGVKLGNLDPDHLIARLGGGTFRIFNKRGERTVTLVGALKTFSPAKAADPDFTQQWIQTPNGPQLVTLPRGTPPPPPMMTSGWGSPWAGGGMQQQPDIAKAVAEALKPFLEILKPREDGGKIALEVEKMKLEIAREEAKGRAAEAKERAAADIAIAREERTRRESEMKHQAELEGKRLDSQMQAQVKAAEALAKAQTEMAAASVKSAEMRAKSEEGQVDRFFKWQEKLAPRESPLSEMLGVYKSIHNIAGKDTLATIFDGLPKVVTAIGAEVRQIAASMPPGQPGAAANPAAVQPLDPQTVTEIEEFMSVVQTCRTAIREKRDAAQTAALLWKPNGAPRVMKFIMSNPPQAVAEQGKRLAEAPDAHVSPANKQVLGDLFGLFATEEGKAWFGAFYMAVKGGPT